MGERKGVKKVLPVKQVNKACENSVPQLSGQDTLG